MEDTNKENPDEAAAAATTMELDNDKDNLQEEDSNTSPFTTTVHNHFVAKQTIPQLLLNRQVYGCYTFSYPPYARPRQMNSSKLLSSKIAW